MQQSNEFGEKKRWGDSSSDDEGEQQQSRGKDLQKDEAVHNGRDRRSYRRHVHHEESGLDNKHDESRETPADAHQRKEFHKNKHVSGGKYPCTQQLYDFGKAGCAYGSNEPVNGLCSKHKSDYDMFYARLARAMQVGDMRILEIQRCFGFIHHTESDQQISMAMGEAERLQAENIRLRQASVSKESEDAIAKREKESAAKLAGMKRDLEEQAKRLKEEKAAFDKSHNEIMTRVKEKEKECVDKNAAALARLEESQKKLADEQRRQCEETAMMAAKLNKVSKDVRVVKKDVDIVKSGVAKVEKLADAAMQMTMKQLEAPPVVNIFVASDEARDEALARLKMRRQQRQLMDSSESCK